MEDHQRFSMEDDQQLSRRTFLASAAALGVLGLAGCGGGGSSGGSAAGASQKAKAFSIGVEDGYTGNTWRTQANQAMISVSKQLQNQGVISNFQLLTSPNNASVQLTHIQDLLSKKPDAILFAPVTNASAQTAAARIKAAGIPAYIIIDPAPTPTAMNIVGGDNTWWAVQAQWLVEQLNGHGKIIMVTGLPGNGSDIVRTQSVKKILAQHPGIQVVASVPGNWDPGVARQKVAPVLATHPHIDAVLTQDFMAPGIIQAFKAANRPLPKYMTGDYEAGFLRTWSQLPQLQSIGVPYTTTIGSDALKIVIRLLQGHKLKPSALSDNEVNPSLKNNALLMPPALAVTRDGKRGSWTPPSMQVISLKEALKRTAGKPAPYALQAPLSNANIDALFQ